MIYSYVSIILQPWDEDVDEQELVRNSETSEEASDTVTVPNSSVAVRDGSAQTYTNLYASTMTQCSIELQDTGSQTDQESLKDVIHTLVTDNYRMRKAISDLSAEVRDLKSLHGDVSEILATVRQMNRQPAPVAMVLDDAHDKVPDDAIYTLPRNEPAAFTPASARVSSSQMPKITPVASRVLFRVAPVASPGVSAAPSSPMTAASPAMQLGVAPLTHSPAPVYPAPVESSPSMSMVPPTPSPSRHSDSVQLGNVDLILKDPLYGDMPPDKACTRVAVRLADVTFGPEVLAASNLTGRDHLSALSPKLLLHIHNIIKREYETKLPDNMPFSSVWKRCRDSIGAKCKNYRSKKR